MAEEIKGVDELNDRQKEARGKIEARVQAERAALKAQFSATAQFAMECAIEGWGGTEEGDIRARFITFEQILSHLLQERFFVAQIGMANAQQKAEREASEAVLGLNNAKRIILPSRKN